MHARIYLRSSSLQQKLKAFIVKGSTLDNPDVPDLPMVTTFDKVIFSLMQTTVISFNLIAIYGERYLYGNYEIIFY